MSLAPSDAPVVTDATLAPFPRKHGLLSVAEEITEIGHPSWIYGGVDFETFCAEPNTTEVFCLTDPMDPITDKQSFSSERANMEVVIAYALYECKSVGEPINVRAAKARTVLDEGSEHVLEETLAAKVAADPDVVTATATDLLDAIAQAEGLPGYRKGRVIHVNPADLVRLSGLGVMDNNGGMLATFVGTPIVAGTGYDEGTVFVTGPVGYVSAESFVSEPVLDRTNNIVYALAEQAWAVGYDCAPTVITVT